MSRKPHPPKVPEKYWRDWLGRIQELYGQTRDIQNYSGYIYKQLEKEGFWPTDKQLTTRLRKWRTERKLVYPMTSTSQPGPVNDGSSAKATDKAQIIHPNRGCDTSQPDPVNDDSLTEDMVIDWGNFIQATGDNWFEEGMQWS